MAGLITTEQCKKLIGNYMSHRGEGGFMTGVVLSTAPLSIRVEDRLTISEGSLYSTENCVGLTMHFRHKHENQQDDLQNDVVVREPLKPGDAVLLLCRPTRQEQSERYILLDRIRPYQQIREVDTR